MGLRFQRRVTIVPGVRLNFSRSGASLSLGPRGASMTLGRRGTYANLGLPGTGFSWRQKVGAAPESAGRRSGAGPSRADLPAPGDLAILAKGDGTVDLATADGMPLPAPVRADVVRAYRDALRPQLDAAVSRQNEARRLALQVHLETPAPQARIAYAPAPYPVPKPEPPDAPEPSLIQRLFGRTDDLHARHEQALSDWRTELARWRAEKANHEQRERAQQRRFDALASSAPLTEAAADLALAFLEERFRQVAWPHETHVFLGLDQGHRTVVLSIDLPEIEDMPDTEIVLDGRSLETGHKPLKDLEIRKLWYRHAHAVVFRAIGEAFAGLPRAGTVLINAYTQRRDPATARITDETVLAVEADRRRWEAIDFSSLDHLDIVQALELLGTRRAGRGYNLAAIDPLPIDP